MTPENILEWAKALGIVGTIVFGGFAVFSPSWVWLRRNLFGWGGAVLCGLGTVLLVSPIFRNIHFVVDTQKLELKLTALQAQLNEVRGSLTVLDSNIQQANATKGTEPVDLNKKLQGIQEAYQSLQTDLPKLTERLDGLQTVAADIRKADQAQLNDLDRKIQGIQSTVLAFGNEIPKIGTLSNRIGSLELVASDISKDTKRLTEYGKFTPILTATGHYDPKSWLHVGDAKVSDDWKMNIVGWNYLPPQGSLPVLSATALPEYQKLTEALTKLPEYQAYLEKLKQSGFVFPDKSGSFWFPDKQDTPNPK